MNPELGFGRNYSREKLNPFSKLRISSYLWGIPTSGTLIQAGLHLADGNKSYSALGLGIAGFYASIGAGLYFLDYKNQTRTRSLKEIFWDKPKPVTDPANDIEFWNEPYTEPHKVEELYPNIEHQIGDFEIWKDIKVI